VDEYKKCDDAADEDKHQQRAT